MNEKPEIPATVPGHWETEPGHGIAVVYAALSRDGLACSDLSDFTIANRMFMASRNDLDLIMWQTAAKERIRWLSVHLAIAQSKLDKQAAP